METLLKTPHHVELATDGLETLQVEPLVMDYGMIIICRDGTARIRTNFDEWQLVRGTIITLFPNDAVEVTDVSPHFQAQWLSYDAALLREASLQVEHTVYSQLRNDRCRSGETTVSHIVNAMFTLLEVFFSQKDCGCLNELVLTQLQAFFMGYHDFLRQNPSCRPQSKSSPRVQELFNRFMENLENHFKEAHTVSTQAALLNISTKYLTTIVRKMTGHSPKVIIDHFLVLQLKLSLWRSEKSIRELAWEYNFEDDAFFCHFFKRHTGISPHKYRKSIREKRL